MSLISTNFLATSLKAIFLPTCFAHLLQNCNPGQKSLGQYCNIRTFLSFLGSLLEWCILFENFLQFSLPPPYTKLKLEKNSGYRRPTLFVGWGEGLDLCELENATEMKVNPILLSMIVPSPETAKCNATKLNLYRNIFGAQCEIMI